MWVADLADTAAIGELGRRAWDTLGEIDVLINNAAVPKRRAVTALDPFDAEAVMRVNFFAPMHLTCGSAADAGTRFRHHRQCKSSVGSRLGVVAESALLCKGIRAVRMERVDGGRPGTDQGYR
jgi:NAD(P)-dependent dehydrogenase (short-subunit alcohol dehydrogenase family)